MKDKSKNSQSKNQSKSLPLVLCAIMCKDEAPRIVRTMNTVVDYVDLFVVLDTGSTDNTVLVVEGFCKYNDKQLIIKQEPFIDFSASRNRLLDMCHGQSEFILLMDANDEAIHPEVMIKFLKERLPEKKECVFSTNMELFNDVRMGARTKYSRINIIRNVEGIYYEMPVHEKLTCDDPAKFRNNTSLTTTEFKIYQDRAMDKPSNTRYARDIKLLKQYGDDHGYDQRILHYLCQTYANMEDFVNLKIYAGKQIALGDLAPNAPFNEYNFYSFLHCGSSTYALSKDKVKDSPEWTKWFLKAFEYSKKGPCLRCEPYYILSIFNLQIKNIKMAKLYIAKACEVPLPPIETRLSTQIDFDLYENSRYSLRDYLNKDFPDV